MWWRAFAGLLVEHRERPSWSLFVSREVAVRKWAGIKPCTLT